MNTRYKKILKHFCIMFYSSFSHSCSFIESLILPDNQFPRKYFCLSPKLSESFFFYFYFPLFLVSKKKYTILNFGSAPALFEDALLLFFLFSSCPNSRLLLTSSPTSLVGRTLVPRPRHFSTAIGQLLHFRHFSNESVRTSRSTCSPLRRTGHEILKGVATPRFQNSLKVTDPIGVCISLIYSECLPKKVGVPLAPLKTFFW
jgi:hypothetical protein